MILKYRLEHLMKLGFEENKSCFFVLNFKEIVPTLYKEKCPTPAFNQ